MSIKKILVVTAEPRSVFLEIFFKYLKSKNNKAQKKTTILVGNIKLIKSQAKIFNFKKKFNEITDAYQALNNKINLINIKKKRGINKKYIQKYISDSFEKCLEILREDEKIVLLNGPIEKKSFLKKKYLGMTEYLAKKTNSKNPVMLIYNEKISVSPITTHLPIKRISKNISKKKIVMNVKSINNFYLKNLKKKPKFAILGLNPHCESIEKKTEEIKYIIPAIKNLKKRKLDVSGPFSADTFFIKKNIKKFDVVIGMYHDQVLTPLKTLYNFNAINITVGLPFIRISPDHGPNKNMFKKNQSDPASIFCAMRFLNKIR